ncbi:MAG: glycosyltransferase family 2 protein [Candidatus Methanoperedens sp.]|nr:glycosyltransferase family 2 protein [Candidatus Methanoperedens sp.]MCE8428515.1 glycosyltransferase family 2 protein [Candidatus Methanoperedens sp.]
MSLINKYGIEKKISIVVPTLNEGPNIKHVFSNIPEFIDEIVVVDGNSTDGTREEIKKYRNDAKIIIENRRGKGQALKTGFENASGDIVVIMDADGSHNTKEMPRLLKPVLDGYDASHGSRMLPDGGSDDFTTFRKLGNKMFVSLVNYMYGSQYTDLCYGYRAFKKEAIEKMNCNRKGFEIETEQSIRIAKAGIKVKEIPSFETSRMHGNSNLNSFKDGWKILDVIIKEYVKDFGGRK